MTTARGHLGVTLSALVDGELDHDSRDRALAHVANCPNCRLDLEAERQIKARLRDAGSGPTAELTRRLLALGEPDRLGPGGVQARAGAPAIALPGSRPAPAGSGSGARALVGRRPAVRASHRRLPPRPPARAARRTAVLAAGAMTLGGSTIGGAFLLATAPAYSPAPVQPAPGAALSGSRPRQAPTPAVGAVAPAALQVLTLPAASPSPAGGDTDPGSGTERTGGDGRRAATRAGASPPSDSAAGSTQSGGWSIAPPRPTPPWAAGSRSAGPSLLQVRLPAAGPSFTSR